MLKAMVFIDGSWLYRARGNLRKVIGDPKLAIDYAKLPRVLARRLGEQLGSTEVDLIRTHFFASIPSNVDPRDEEEIEEQRDFYDRLKEDFHYETEIFSIDFRGRRLHRKDRPPTDPFMPQEKCVDIALASSAMYYAAIPYAYDAAIVVIGDEDYVPVLQLIRRLGRRVMIASIHGSCAWIYDPNQDPTDSKRVRDCDTVFLDDIIEELLLEYPLRQLECRSPLHKGDLKVWTRYQPRKGGMFYCDECRKMHQAQRREAEEDLKDEYPEERLSRLLEGFVAGKVTRIFPEKGFGFIRSKDGETYFFHHTAVRQVEFSSLTESQYVQFLPRTELAPGQKYKGVTEVQPL